MKRKIKTLNTVAIILLAVQLLAYLGSMNVEDEVIADPAERAGYYIGYNLLLMISIGLFIRANLLRRKMRKNEELDMINSIGEPQP